MCFLMTDPVEKKPKSPSLDVIIRTWFMSAMVTAAGELLPMLQHFVSKMLAAKLK